MIFQLKVLFLVLAVLSFCSSLPDQPSPPILPQHFTQKFVEGYHTVKYYTTGQVWYDWTQQAQRIDRTDGRYEILCGSVMPNVVTPCTQLLVNGQFYIIYPQKKQCCRCCSAASGCKIDSRQQLSLFQYDGTSVLQGQQFYKWTYQHQVDFYDTQDQKRIPRRTDQIGYKFMDFIMASFNTQKINPNIFSLPSYCNSDCPRNTICGDIQPGNSQILQTPKKKQSSIKFSFKQLINQTKQKYSLLKSA